MKKLLIPTLLTASLFASMSDKELKHYKNNELLKADNINLVSGKKIDKDFAMLKGYVDAGNGNYVPLNVITNNKIVITGGQVFDAQTKQKMSVEMDLKKFIKNAAFTMGDGKEDIFLFTEGECPYCYRFETQSLNKIDMNKYKLHVFMFPLESIHYLAKDMSVAVLSQPIEKRASYYRKLMEMNQNNKAELLKEVGKYSIDFYERILSGVNSLNDNRAKQMSQKYIATIESMEGKRFKSISEVSEYCNNKIIAFKSDKAKYSLYQKTTSILDEQKKIASLVGVSGTPSLFDMKNKQIREQQLFRK